ncbi:MAG: MaoC family dehydratase [Candidatus Tectimicrobiota bacterium]|nr:MAG: MaoC family dehydratase [Candidatus Tectomicrobia bacterium]
MKIIHGLEELKRYVGQEIGVSNWLEVTQERINAFADATGDHQWIHVDVERAKRESPYGAPIAHGFLTLSLIPQLVWDIYKIEGVKMGVNYGLNRVRFPAPVPAGSRIRARAKLLELQEVEGGVQAVSQVTVEREGHDKPVCVAETVSRWYF